MLSFVTPAADIPAFSSKGMISLRSAMQLIPFASPFMLKAARFASLRKQSVDCLRDTLWEYMGHYTDALAEHGKATPFRRQE